MREVSSVATSGTKTTLKLVERQFNCTADQYNNYVASKLEWSEF